MTATPVPPEPDPPPAAAPNEIVVFIVRRDTQCAECQRELDHGTFIRLSGDKALCLGCADLDHLWFLPRGDAAVSRRARKYSQLSAVVLQWSRARKRYERQGLLAEEEAIRRAEEESLADADARARRRAREAVRRADLDAEYVASFASAIGQQFPRCPADEATQIAEHACRKYSGRIGRSAAAKEFEPVAIRLAVVAHIRHAHTRYDEILMRTDDRPGARAEVADEIDRVLQRWQTV